MKDKIIILFDYPNKDLNIKKIAIKKKLQNNF